MIISIYIQIQSLICGMVEKQSLMFQAKLFGKKSGVRIGLAHIKKLKIKDIKIVIGGKTRAESAHNALEDIRNENILETFPELAELYEKN